MHSWALAHSLIGSAAALSLRASASTASLPQVDTRRSVSGVVTSYRRCSSGLKIVCILPDHETLLRNSSSLFGSQKECLFLLAQSCRSYYGCPSLIFLPFFFSFFFLSLSNWFILFVMFHIPSAVPRNFRGSTSFFHFFSFSLSLYSRLIIFIIYSACPSIYLKLYPMMLICYYSM